MCLAPMIKEKGEQKKSWYSKAIFFEQIIDIDK